MSSDSGSASGSSGISRARELLAQAVQFLDSSAARNPSFPRARDSQTPAQSQFVDRRRSPWSAHCSSSSTGDRESSALAERSLLFNFGGKKRLGSGGGNKKKKQRIVTFWNHDFVCLSDTEQDTTPTANERARLIAAGVFSYYASICHVFGKFMSHDTHKLGIVSMTSHHK